MKQEKISIIVPVYNAEQYLRKCIDSIMNQSYKNIEVIIINDGSKDDSKKICDDYEKKYVNIKVIHQENSGVSSARNKGIAFASGKYIGFVDADDYIEENMYEKMFENMINSNVDVVACNLYFEDEFNKCLYNYNHNDYIIDRNSYCIEMYNNLSLQGYACNKLYNSRIIKKYHIEFNNNYSVLEDDLFNYEIFFHNKTMKVKYINDKLYHYVMRNTGVSKSNFSLKKLAYLDVRNSEIGILEKEKISSDILKADYNIVYKRMCFLAKNNKIYDKNIFNKYLFKYKQYKKDINYKELSNSLKIKYIIIRYLPFIYYLKMIIKGEK